MIQKTFVQTETGTIARVVFTLPDSIWADSIYLVGDFNNWNQTTHQMAHNQQGQWTITVELELGRAYQFRYLRDGEWMNDNQADAYVYNPYESHNFVVVTDPEFKPYRG